MALNIADEYPYAEPPSADYPYGAFKNDSTGSAGDGTPVDNRWGKDILGFLQALLVTAGIVPSGAPDTALSSQYLKAMQAIMWTPSDMKFVFRSAPGAGWLEANGGTIGDAASAASERANADTFPLFAYMWALAPMQLFTSAGVAVARGASAAADFAVHRKITIPDMRGCDAKGWDHGRGFDPGRVLGSYQADAQQNVTGVINIDGNSSTLLSGAFERGAASVGPGGSGEGYLATFDASRVARTAPETRTKNNAGMWIIKY